MELTYFSRNILVLAPEGFILLKFMSSNAYTNSYSVQVQTSLPTHENRFSVSVAQKSWSSSAIKSTPKYPQADSISVYDNVSENVTTVEVCWLFPTDLIDLFQKDYWSPLDII